jgi:hypothetical protein
MCIISSYGVCIKFFSLETAARKRKAYYATAVEDVFGTATVIHLEPHQIPQFGSDRLKWTTAIPLSEDKMSSMGRILCVLRELGDIRYGPMIPTVTASLLKYIGESDSYRAILKMCQTKNDFYLHTTKKGAMCQVLTFKTLLRDHLKESTYEKIRSLEGSFTEEMYLDWFTYLFRGWMTEGHAERVFFSFCVDGIKTLYRYSVAVLKMHEDLITRASSETAFVTEIRHSLSSPTFNFDTLWKIAYNLNIRRADLDKMKDGMDEDGSFTDRPTLKRHLEGSGIFASRIPRIVGHDVKLLNVGSCRSILHYLPSRLREKDLKLIFSTDVNGFNLTTMYNTVSPHGPSLLLVQTTKHVVMGCFSSHAWRLHKQPFGNRHCFVFTFVSGAEGLGATGSANKFKCYPAIFSSSGGNDDDDDLDEDEQILLTLSEMAFKSVRQVNFQSVDNLTMSLVFDPDVFGKGLRVSHIDDRARKMDVFTATGEKGPLEEAVKKGDVVLSINGFKVLGVEYTKAKKIISSLQTEKSVSVNFADGDEYQQLLSQSSKSVELSAMKPTVTPPVLTLEGSGSNKAVDRKTSNDTIEFNVAPLSPPMSPGASFGGPTLPPAGSTSTSSSSSIDRAKVLQHGRPRSMFEIRRDSSSSLGVKRSESDVYIVERPSSSAEGEKPKITLDNSRSDSHIRGGGGDSRSGTVAKKKKGASYMITQAHFCQMGSDDFGNAALRINEDLGSGSTFSTTLFNNEPLTGTGSNTFDISLIEVYSFVMPQSGFNSKAGSPKNVIKEDSFVDKKFMSSSTNVMKG